MEHHAADEGWLPFQRVLERLDAGGVGHGDLAAGLDFKGHEPGVLFEQEIHFMPRPVTPEVKVPAAGIQRPPGLQGLKEGLLQPETGIGAVGEVAGGSNPGQGRGQSAVRPQQLGRLDNGDRRIGGVSSEPVIRVRIERACAVFGLVCPDICTPAELMKL